MGFDTKDLKTITLLYVEDDEMVREQTYTILTKIFKKVFVAFDGKEGLEAYKANQNEIDVIVTDLNMPMMNGLEMIRSINELNPQIPTIVTSAHTDSKFIINAMESNVDKYIPKPVQIKELTVSIVELVKKYRKLNNIENIAKVLMEKNKEDQSLHSSLNERLEKVQLENNYLKAIVDNLVLQVKIDKSSKIMESSEKFLRFFGLAKDDIVGRSIDIIRCDTCKQESFQKLMLKAIHTKKSITSVYIFKRKDGASVSGDLTITPSYDNNMLVSSYTLYIDIS